MRRALLALAYFLAAAVALAFLTLPILAIFLRVPPGRLIDQLSNPVVTDALIVSFKTTLIAQLLVLLFGTATA
jgi:molybdate transport system permease protein